MVHVFDIKILAKPNLRCNGVRDTLFLSMRCWSRHLNLLGSYPLVLLANPFPHKVLHLLYYSTNIENTYDLLNQSEDLQID